jgi:hypothetical protein
MPRVEENFRDIIRRHVPAEKIAMRIAEGLDATETRFATFEGKITDSKECIAYGERRQYAELAAKLSGVYPDKKELDTPDAKQWTLVVDL